VINQTSGIIYSSYVQQSISVYNRMNVLIYYFVPFIIKVLAITILIIQVAQSRPQTNSSKQERFVNLFQKQFKAHREHYFTPIIIVFSVLLAVVSNWKVQFYFSTIPSTIQLFNIKLFASRNLPTSISTPCYPSTPHQDLAPTAPPPPHVTLPTHTLTPSSFGES
jgi:hypothetical protein